MVYADAITLIKEFFARCDDTGLGVLDSIELLQLEEPELYQQATREADLIGLWKAMRIHKIDQKKLEVPLNVY